MFFDPAAAAIAEVAPGERFTVETLDSLCGLAKRTTPQGWHIDDVVDRLGGACPLTGPFHITGAQAGDVLEVELHVVSADPPEGQAWTAVLAGFGALSSDAYSIQPALTPETQLVPYRDGIAQLPARGGHVAIPMTPFLGTLGVAPRWERRMSFSQSPEYLGDVDLPAIGPGATVVLPVNVNGGLLALGDAHAAQGDGEITGAAIEIEAIVELSVQVRHRADTDFASLPQVNTEAFIGSVAGLQGSSLSDCARAAYVDLLHRLVRNYRFSQTEAYELLGQVGRLSIGNMIDPFYSVLASIERVYL